MILLESFRALVTDPNHWLFELLVGGIEELVLGVIIGAVFWPKVKAHFHRDINQGVEKKVDG